MIQLGRSRLEPTRWETVLAIRSYSVLRSETFLIGSDRVRKDMIRMGGSMSAIMVTGFIEEAAELGAIA